MSALIPGPQEAAVDPRQGFFSRVWYQFFVTLTKLPSARISGSASYNPPSIAAGAMTSTDVTVSGALVGWAADAAFSLGLGGLTLSAGVKAANTVTVTLHNPTGSPIDLGAGTMTAFAWKP